MYTFNTWENVEFVRKSVFIFCLIYRKIRFILRSPSISCCSNSYNHLLSLIRKVTYMANLSDIHNIFYTQEYAFGVLRVWIFLIFPWEMLHLVFTFQFTERILFVASLAEDYEKLIRHKLPHTTTHIKLLFMLAVFFLICNINTKGMAKVDGLKLCCICVKSSLSRQDENKDESFQVAI